MINKMRVQGLWSVDLVRQRISIIGGMLSSYFHGNGGGGVLAFCFDGE